MLRPPKFFPGWGDKATMVRRTKTRKRTVKARDPFWRLRRVFGEKTRPSAKAYRRAETRRAERAPEPGDG